MFQIKLLRIFLETCFNHFELKSNRHPESVRASIMWRVIQIAPAAVTGIELLVSAVRHLVQPISLAGLARSLSSYFTDK